MKHQLLMFCNAGKLEELKENQCAAPISENNEHTQGFAGWALPASLRARWEAALQGGEGFQLLFQVRVLLSHGKAWNYFHWA